MGRNYIGMVMEEEVNTLRAKSLDVREQYERQIKELQEGYGEVMLELSAQKSWRPCWARNSSDRNNPPGTSRRWIQHFDQ